MKKTILLILLVLSIVLTGCKEDEPEQIGNKVILDGVTFTYNQLPIRNWKQRTDMFELDHEGCLVMQGNSFVEYTFHEANFIVNTDLDLCAYRYVKLNSTIESITKRESISPSSQIHIQNVKYSSGSNDNATKGLYSHNLKFYNDGVRVSWIDDEMKGYDTSCGNLTIGILASAGENGTAFASMKICDIELGSKR